MSKNGFIDLRPNRAKAEEKRRLIWHFPYSHSRRCLEVVFSASFVRGELKVRVVVSRLWPHVSVRAEGASGPPRSRLILDSSTSPRVLVIPPTAVRVRGLAVAG